MELFSGSTQLSTKFQLLIKIKIPTNKKKNLALSLSDVVFIMLINVKMPTIVGILTFMSRINFVLSRVEHGKSFITSGPELSDVNSFNTISFIPINPFGTNEISITFDTVRSGWYIIQYLHFHCESLNEPLYFRCHS